MSEETAPRTVVVQKLDDIEYHVDQAYHYWEALETKILALNERRQTLEKNGEDIPATLLAKANDLLRDALKEQLWKVEGEGWEDWKKGDIGSLIRPHVEILMRSLAESAWRPEGVMEEAPTSGS